MTSKKLLILAIVAVIAVVAGVSLTNRQAATSRGESATLYPALKSERDAVTTVRIVKAGGTPAVELKRGESGWTVSERANYPADDAKLRKLVNNLAEAKLIEEKTSTAEHYPALGVEDISNAAAGGVQLELEGMKEPLKLIVGKQGSGAAAQYVRRAGEPKSWLVNKSIDTSASPDQWLRKSVLDVSADRIQSATVTVGSAKPFSVAKKTRADADYAVDGLPKGKELSSPSAADSFATALAGLTLSDVQSASAVTGEPSARASYKTFDGLIVDATGWKKDDKHYVALKTSYDAAIAEQFKLPTAAPAPEKKEGEGGTAPADAKAAADEKPAAEPAKANVEEEAKTANARVTGWVYEIPVYKYDAMFKPLDELIKK